MDRNFVQFKSGLFIIVMRMRLFCTMVTRTGVQNVLNETNAVMVFTFRKQI